MKNLIVKAASVLGVAAIGVLVSLPGFTQQSPDNAGPSAPSQVKPLNGSPNSTDKPNSTDSNQTVGTPDHKDPASDNSSPERVEGSGNGNQSGVSNTQSDGNGSGKVPDANNGSRMRQGN